MAIFNSYYLYEKYEKRGDQPWIPSYPNTWSINGDGTMPLVLKEQGDPECIPPIYRWVQTEDMVCIELQYRWVESGTTCIGYDLYQNNIKEQSIDGIHWSVVTPTEYSASTIIEADSPSCGYVPPFDGKYMLILNDSSVVTAACDSTSSITSGEVSSIYSGTCLYIEVGDCVTSIGDYAFGHKPGTYSKMPILTGVTFSDTVTTFGEGVFARCSELKNVNLPINLTTIPQSTFDRSGLVSVTIPSGVTSIGDSSFFVCSNLNRLNSDTDGVANIPNNVTEIGYYAFQGCTSLTSVTIPSGVTSIGDFAFARNSNLTSLTCYAITPPEASIDFVLYLSDNCLIYVPAGSVNTYKTDSGWSVYADRIQAIQ